MVTWISEIKCGIIGYVGKKAASPVLPEGLRRLEYRGDDSAGVTILQDADLLLRKKQGWIDDGIARESDSACSGPGINFIPAPIPKCSPT